MKVICKKAANGQCTQTLCNHFSEHEEGRFCKTGADTVCIPSEKK